MALLSSSSLPFPSPSASPSPSPLRLRRLPPRPISAASADAAANADADHRLVVSGGGRLAGHVGVSGSKNAALAVLAGALCCSSGAAALRGVPDLSDTRTMAAVLRSLGARVEERGGGEVVVDAGAVTSVEPDSEAIGRIRAGFFVLGPLVARFGEAEVALPGGCRIGARPIDLYLRGLAALGAVVQLR